MYICDLGPLQRGNIMILSNLFQFPFSITLLNFLFHFHFQIPVELFLVLITYPVYDLPFPLNHFHSLNLSLFPVRVSYSFSCTRKECHTNHTPSFIALHLWLFQVYEGRMDIFGLDQGKQTFVLRRVTTQYNISSRIDVQTQTNTEFFISDFSLYPFRHKCFYFIQVMFNNFVWLKSK